METPQFSPKGVNWAMALRFYHIRHFFFGNRLSSLPIIVSARRTTPGHEQCESSNSEVWTPSYTESSRKLSCTRTSARISRLSSWRANPANRCLPDGHLLDEVFARPKQFRMGTHSTENLRVRVFFGAFLSKKRKNCVVLDSKRKASLGNKTESTFRL